MQVRAVIAVRSDRANHSPRPIPFSTLTTGLVTSSSLPIHFIQKNRVGALPKTTKSMIAG